MSHRLFDLERNFYAARGTLAILEEGARLLDSPELRLSNVALPRHLYISIQAILDHEASTLEADAEHPALDDREKKLVRDALALMRRASQNLADEAAALDLPDA